MFFYKIITNELNATTLSFWINLNEKHQLKQTMVDLKESHEIISGLSSLHEIEIQQA